MLRIRTFVLLIIVYIISFISIKFDINMFYPFDLVKNYLFMPVIASVGNKDVSNSLEYQETMILELKDEIDNLRKLTEVKTVLSDYKRVNVTVIERNRNYWFNTLMIDKGSNDGIKVDDSLVDYYGLIGKISKVYPNMSEVKLITTSDINNKTSVLIVNENEKVYGIIEGCKDGYLEVVLTSKNISIKEGCKVMTTGMGGIYPSGILIGTTVSIKTSKYDVGLIVLVKPASNFQNLKYLSVLVRN